MPVADFQSYINLIAKYEQNYAVSDKQDVLAMSALQFASKLEILSLDKNDTKKEEIEKISELTKLVSSHLK